MVFHGAPPPPPVDPNDARAIRKTAEDHQRQRAGGADDIGHILGWIGAAIRWPFRQVLKVVRR